MNDAIKMQVSAFVDGELPENEAELLVRRLSQDYELRQQVADYLAIGRVMRRESGVAGVERLRERISAELDERPSQDGADRASASDSSRLLRPLGSVAIAATVALVAIIGLRQAPGPAGADTDETPATIVNVVTDDTYTEPAPDDDMLQQFRLIHGEVASGLGAIGINPRVVTLQISEGVLVEDGSDDEDAAATDTDDTDDPAQATSQPQ